MDYDIISSIEQRTSSFLNNDQMKKLHLILIGHLSDANITKNNENAPSDIELINSFISAKHVEGCSIRTLNYYQTTMKNVLNGIAKPIKQIVTNDIRIYLAEYQNKNKISKVTIDNVRRILSSFFSWLEDEDHIIKSPVRRIKKVKVAKIVKDVYSDESLELMRDGCETLRDLAIVDLLSSTGMRVGELVNLNREDIDFQNRECVVTGKGDKERLVYFDARTKVHLSNYLNSREDVNSSLFVSLLKPHRRLQISGVESRLKQIGLDLNMIKVHPHKFRRTLATRAIDKGMPIEQVQRLLGHQKIDTTLEYAMVNQANVKISHTKYIC